MYNMFNEQSRRNLFLFVCIPVRLIIATLITYLDKNSEDDNVKLAIQIYLFTTAAVFLINMIRTHYGFKTEGGFGGDEWWAVLRPIHILLYTAAGILVTLDLQLVETVMYQDVVYGAILYFTKDRIG